MKKCVSFIILTITILMISSCKLNNDPFNVIIEGDFVFSTSGCGEKIAIIDLSEEGKKKETLVFPTEANGRIVRGIGAQFMMKTSGHIEIDCATKIYIPAGYTSTKELLEYSYENEDTVVNLFLADSKNLSAFYYYINEYDNANIYVTGETLNLMENQKVDIPNRNKANVIYYVNDESYFVDYVENSTITAIPPKPVKEGYVFDGWYKDDNFTEQWNFDSDIVYSDITSFMETKLYAKWIAE